MDVKLKNQRRTYLRSHSWFAEKSRQTYVYYLETTALSTMYVLCVSLIILIKNKQKTPCYTQKKFSAPVIALSETVFDITKF